MSAPSLESVEAVLQASKALRAAMAEFMIEAGYDAEGSRRLDQFCSEIDAIEQVFREWRRALVRALGEAGFGGGKPS